MAGNQPTFKDLLTDVMLNYVNEVIRYPQSPYTKSALAKYFSGQPMTPEEAMWISQNATSDYDVYHTMAYYRRLLNENADNLQKYSVANQNNPILSPDVSAAAAYASQYARPQAAPVAAPQIVVPPVSAVPAAAPVSAPAAAPAAAPVAALAAPVAAAPVVAPPPPAAAPAAAAPVAAAPVAAAPAPWSVGNVTPQMIQSRAQQSSLDARIVEMFASARPEELALFTAAAKFINTGETPEDPMESQNMFNYMQSDDPLWTSYVEKNYGDPLRFYNEAASAANAARQIEYSDAVVAFDPKISRDERTDQRVYLDQEEQKKRLNRRQGIESNLQGKIDFGVQQGSGEEFYSPSGTEEQNAAQSALQKVNFYGKVAAVQGSGDAESRRFYPETNLYDKVAAFQGSGDAESQRFYPEVQSETSRQLAALAESVAIPSQDRMFAAAGVANLSSPVSVPDIPYGEYSVLQNPTRSGWGPAIPNQQEMYKNVSTPDQRDFRYVPSTEMYPSNASPVSVPDIPYGEYSVLQNPTRWSGFDINAKVESQNMYPVSQPSGVPWGEPQSFVSSEKMYPVDTGTQSFVVPEDAYGVSSPSVYGPPQTTVSQEKMYSIDVGSEFVPYASSEDVYGSSRPSVYGPPQNAVSQEKMYFPESTGNAKLPVSERLRMLSNTISSEGMYGGASGWGVPQSKVSSEETYFVANKDSLPSWDDRTGVPQDKMYGIPFQKTNTVPVSSGWWNSGQTGGYGDYTQSMDKNTRPGGASFGWKDDPEYADALSNDATITQPGPKETMRLRDDVPDYRGRATNSSMQRYRGAQSDPAYAEEVTRDAIPVLPVPEDTYQSAPQSKIFGGLPQLLRNTQAQTRRPTKWGGY